MSNQKAGNLAVALNRLLFWCTTCRKFEKTLNGDGDIVCAECRLVITSFKLKSAGKGGWEE